jgi:hypothetical protein
MIVNLPQRLIFHPRYLHSFIKSDSVLKNDFTIKATDYYLYYNYWNNLDYKLTAGLTLNAIDLGTFDVSSVSTSFNIQCIKPPLCRAERCWDEFIRIWQCVCISNLSAFSQSDKQ